MGKQVWNRTHILESSCGEPGAEGSVVGPRSGVRRGPWWTGISVVVVATPPRTLIVHLSANPSSFESQDFGSCLNYSELSRWWWSVTEWNHVHILSHVISNAPHILCCWHYSVEWWYVACSRVDKIPRNMYPASFHGIFTQVNLNRVDNSEHQYPWWNKIKTGRISISSWWVLASSHITKNPLFSTSGIQLFTVRCWGGICV